MPLTEQLKEYFDDTERYVKACVRNRICVICGKPGDIHHLDAIGMGRNRNKIDDSGYRKICLCRVHHTEAHQVGWNTFTTKYHLGV